jgi:hypothetical protein
MNKSKKLGQLVWLHEEYWTKLARGNPTHAKFFRDWFRKVWDPFYTDWLEKSAIADERFIKTKSYQLSQIRERARLLNLPVPEMTITTVSGANPMTETAIEEFSQSCAVQLSKGDGHTELKVWCTCKDPETGEPRTWSRVVHLDPLVKAVHDKLVAYHTQLHGGVSVSGWGDLLNKAVGTARRVATSASVRSLYNEVSPFLVATIPGGPAAMAVATKAHNVLVKAREGHPKALAAMSALRNAALKGNPSALATLKLMKNMNQLLDVKEAVKPPVEDVEVSGFGDEYIVSGAVDQLLRNPRVRAQYNKLRRVSPALAAKYLRKLADRRPVRPTRAAPSRALSPAPEEGYDQAPEADEGGMYGEPEEFPSEEVSGWLYNRPYRGTVDTLMSSQKSPGVGLAARELYNRGLGRELSQLAKGI